MSSYPQLHPNHLGSDLVLCICGHRFQPSSEQRLYCSRNCAHEDGLRALQGLETQYRRRAQQRMEQPTQDQSTRKPRSRFSKPLPRVLTVWLQEDSTVPPPPPPKSARHLPKSFAQQQEESLAAGLPPRPASLDLSLNPEVAPTPPLKSPRHLQRKKTPPPKRGAQNTFVVAEDAPPVPRVPSKYKKNDSSERDASSHVICTYVPPRASRNTAYRPLRGIVDSIPDDFDQLEATRVSQLMRQVYATPPKTTAPRLTRNEQPSSHVLAEPAPTASVTSVFQVHRDQPHSSLQRPGRRPTISSRAPGDDIPILVPDGYMSDPTEIDSCFRHGTTYRDSRASHRLLEVPQTTDQAPRSGGRKSAQSVSASRRATATSTKSSQTLLDVRFPFDDDVPSDLWQAVQALRLDQDDQDYRRRLVDRPTMYEDSRL